MDVNTESSTPWLLFDFKSNVLEYKVNRKCVTVQTLADYTVYFLFATLLQFLNPYIYLL